MIVLFSVTFDFVQEHRAGKAAERLRQSVSVRAKLVRDGRPVEAPVADVVPGDLVLLSAGDMIPADGLVLEAHDLFVKQALLTGEPYPVEKRPGPLTDWMLPLETLSEGIAALKRKMSAGVGSRRLRNSVDLKSCSKGTRRWPRIWKCSIVMVRVSVGTSKPSSENSAYGYDVHRRRHDLLRIKRRPSEPAALTRRASRGLTTGEPMDLMTRINRTKT
ncbi:MAG: hypothetical protein ACR65T_06115 [Methylocystis sp.]|jgi:magnesium-transporting ATPase (P-type)|uniref:P-type ATPase n=1 Tax=Methylocystis sp. TaxID=1911079 RepID=UPI003DA59EFA